MSLHAVAALLLVGLGVLFAGNAAVQALWLIGGFDYQRGLRVLFDMSREWNAPSLYSGALILANAIALWRVGLRLAQQRTGAWLSWCFLAVVFTYLSVDEVVGFHERLTDVTQQVLHITGGLFTFAWVLPGSAFALAVFLLSLNFLRDLDRSSRLWVMAAGAIYMSGAVGVETLSGWRWSAVGGDLSDPIWVLLFSTEESLEIAGMSLMLFAVLRRSELMFERASAAPAPTYALSPG